MLRVLKGLTDVLFPPHQEVLHARSLSTSKLLETLKPIPGPEPWITVGFHYANKDIRALVRANKYHGHNESGHTMSFLFEELFNFVYEDQFLTHNGSLIIMPMPISRKRRAKRGYGQVERIIEPFIKRNNLDDYYMPKLMCKHERKTQLSVAITERDNNIRNAFYIPKGSTVHGLNILLVDDVSESGATMRDAARALKEAGAHHVFGIALAK